MCVLLGYSFQLSFILRVYVVAHEGDLAQRRSDGAERGGALWDRQSQAKKSKSN